MVGPNIVIDIVTPCEKIIEIVEYWGDNGVPPEWRMRGEY